MQQASMAALPTEPTGPRKLVSILLGSSVGLILGLLFAYGRDLLQVRETQPAAALAPVHLAKPEDIADLKPVAHGNGQHPEEQKAISNKR